MYNYFGHGAILVDFCTLNETITLLWTWKTFYRGISYSYKTAAST